LSPAPFHTQLLFVQPVVRPTPRGSHDFSQGTHSTHNRSGIFKPDSEARGETYQITSALLSSAFAVGKLAHRPALSCGTPLGRNGLGISPSYANYPRILIFFQYQISHSQLLPGGCRGNPSVRHHKVRSRDSEHNTNRLTARLAEPRFQTYQDGLPMREHWEVRTWWLCWWATSQIGKMKGRSSGPRPANGLQRTVRPVKPRLTLSPSRREPTIPVDVHFLEASSLTGDNVEAPFLLCARSILLSIESGALDPEKAGSGVSYGDRALRRVNSSSRLSFGSLSGGRRKGTIKVKLPFRTGRCC
jgi:hypothetical protein